MTSYFTFLNFIDERWKVLDKNHYCMSDGETETEAVLGFLDLNPNVSIDDVKCSKYCRHIIITTLANEAEEKLENETLSALSPFVEVE